MTAMVDGATRARTGDEVAPWPEPGIPTREQEVLAKLSEARRPGAFAYWSDMGEWDRREPAIPPTSRKGSWRNGSWRNGSWRRDARALVNLLSAWALPAGAFAMGAGFTVLGGTAWSTRVEAAARVVEVERDRLVVLAFVGGEVVETTIGAEEVVAFGIEGFEGPEGEEGAYVGITLETRRGTRLDLRWIATRRGAADAFERFERSAERAAASASEGDRGDGEPWWRVTKCSEGTTESYTLTSPTMPRDRALAWFATGSRERADARAEVENLARATARARAGAGRPAGEGA